MNKIKLSIILMAIALISGCVGTQQNSHCSTHSDCEPRPINDCGGPELCAPEYNMFCDNGNCREPQNYTEWEIACKETKESYFRDNCFEIASSRAKDKANTTVAFGICNRNYVSKDDAEACRLKICGFEAAYPDISLGDENCISQAVSSTCNDGRKNGRESDIDCGQFECNLCDDGKACMSNKACKSGICNLNGVDDRYKCVKICPDGPIKNNTPCGCSNQGNENRSVENWEQQYGKGKTLFCCSGEIKQLFPNQKCSG